MWASGRFIRCSQPLPLPLRVAFKAGKKNDTQNSDGTIGRSFHGPVRDWPLRGQGEGCGKGPTLPGAACLPSPLSPGPAPDTASKSSEVGHGTRGLYWRGHSIYFSSSSSGDGVPLLVLAFGICAACHHGLWSDGTPTSSSRCRGTHRGVETAIRSLFRGHSPLQTSTSLFMR